MQQVQDGPIGKPQAEGVSEGTFIPAGKVRGM